MDCACGLRAGVKDVTVVYRHSQGDSAYRGKYGRRDGVIHFLASPEPSMPGA
jgi:hypothetical protein